MKFIGRMRGLTFASKPLYSTNVVEGPNEDGLWTAELKKDGVPYGYVRVGSISALIARST